MVKGLIAAGALAIVAMAAPAGAQQYPPAVNSLTCSDTTPTRGQTITIEGRTFATGSTATVTLSTANGSPAAVTPSAGSVALGSAIANDAGVFALQATIPTDTSLGAHTITAVGTAPGGSALTLSVSCTVVPAHVAPGAGAGASNLPRTGSDSSIPLAKLGLGLAALGGIVTAMAAKRRKAAAAAAEPLTPAPPLV